MNQVESIVIGAGIIGLATARALALRGKEVLILEAENTIGSVTSSRNSGVIHAGIYYNRDSLKARCCVAGRKALVPYLQARGISHRICGKIIIAVNETQKQALQEIKKLAEANGVDDLVLLSAREVGDLEPEVTAVAGLLSPSTGIVDVHELMLSYLADAEANGAILAVRSPVTGVIVEDKSFIVSTGGKEPMTLRCRHLVNAAGLSAQSVSVCIKGLDPAHIPQQKLAKGNYFSLQGKPPFKRLIYPVPEKGGLGIHATIDLAGRVKFGPDVEWVSAINYAVDPARVENFYKSIRRYYPALPDGKLQPDYAGIRPKIVSTDSAEADFVIQDRNTHNIQNLVNLYGIESPGLTSALAIADHVVSKLT
jgi:L-2-hydroxyglutarate oxidase LhgO